jgi:hypothetical protein
MVHSVSVLVICLVPTGLLAPAAGDRDEATLWITDLSGRIVYGIVVQYPTGSSDFLSVAHDVVPGLASSDEVADGLRSAPWR